MLGTHKVKPVPMAGAGAAQVTVTLSCIHKSPLLKILVVTLTAVNGKAQEVEF